MQLLVDQPMRPSRAGQSYHFLVFQVCLRWNIDRGVAVIPESGSQQHIEENIAGIYDWKLPAELKVRTSF